MVNRSSHLILRSTLHIIRIVKMMMIVNFQGVGIHQSIVQFYCLTDH